MKKFKILTGIAVIVSSFALALTVVPTESAFVGKITNSTDTIYSSIQNCKSAAKGTGAAGDAALEAFALGETTATTSAANFITAPTSLGSGTYVNGHTGLAANTTNQPCKHDGGRSVRLNGTSQQVSTPKLSTTQLGNSGSVEIWFKTTATKGVLIGIGDSQTGVSSQKDRMFFLTTAGKLNWAVYQGANCEILSPSAVNNGAWHHAVGTVVSGESKLYLDGALIGTKTTAGCGSDTYANGGYLRIGADSEQGWTNGSGNATIQYFPGDITYGAYYNYVLTPAQAKIHHDSADW